MIPKQVAELRKMVNAGGKVNNIGSTPSTPRKVLSGAGSRAKTAGTVTPSKRSTPWHSAPSVANSASKRRRMSTPTKRKSRNKSQFDASEDEDEASPVEISSSPEEGDENVNASSTDSDDLIAITTKTMGRRVLPARSKSRSKSYVAEADSAGEDAGAKDMDSEIDQEFRLEGEAGLPKRGMANGGHSEDDADAVARAGSDEMADDNEINLSVNGINGRTNSISEHGNEDVKMDGNDDDDSRSIKSASYESATEELRESVE